MQPQVREVATLDRWRTESRWGCSGICSAALAAYLNQWMKATKGCACFQAHGYLHLRRLWSGVAPSPSHLILSVRLLPGSG